MPKTIEEYQASIIASKKMLEENGPFLSKGLTKSLENDIASSQKRIEEMLANLVRLPNGDVVNIGDTVYSFVLPVDKVDNGESVGFKVYARTVQGTKREDGRGYITLQVAQKKFERLSWYEAERFFASSEEAHQGALDSLEAQAQKAYAEYERLTKLVTHVADMEPKFVDLTKSVPTSEES